MKPAAPTVWWENDFDYNYRITQRLRLRHQRTADAELCRDVRVPRGLRRWRRRTGATSDNIFRLVSSRLIYVVRVGRHLARNDDAISWRRADWRAGARATEWRFRRFPGGLCQIVCVRLHSWTPAGVWKMASYAAFPRNALICTLLFGLMRRENAKMFSCALGAPKKWSTVLGVGGFAHICIFFCGRPWLRCKIY